MDGDRGYRSEARPSAKIYISNLNMDTSEDDLRKAFSDFGDIKDITLKHKDSGVTFAFIEYDSEDGAGQAIKAYSLLHWMKYFTYFAITYPLSMNQKDFMNKEVKVEYAKGPRDRGDRNDRGGFRGRGDFERRPQRDFGDRPKGCFNCGEEGHFARDCSKPRQPREFNRDRGGFRGGRDNDRYGGRDKYDDRRDRDRDRRRKDDSRSRSKSNERRRKHRRRSSSGSSRS